MRALRFLLGTLCLWSFGDLTAEAQTFRRGGTEFHAVRPVIAPAGRSWAVVVTEFFHHGQIAADGRNVMAVDQHRNPAPTRVLQLGPGDFCRVAMQTVPGQNAYEIYYGGDPPAEGSIPAWTNNDGLLMETREYKKCNLNQFESVRQAFETSRRIGSGYVDSVQHGCNPFTLVPGPFLSRYWGTLWIKSAGKYGVVTSSQDCSFLLVDGKVVAAAPGHHGPLYQARPGVRKEVQLTAGSHKFEYYHAAAGSQAIMVAAWAASPGDAKAPLVLIPSEAFRGGTIGQVFAGPPSTPGEKLMPDFLINIVGEVPLPESDLPLIGVQFGNASPPGLRSNCKTHWDFGDGQTSDEANPAHVYLCPGLYTVTLKVSRGGKSFEMANKLSIERPRITVRDAGKLPKLDDCLPMLETYDPTTLDAASLVQLILAYRFKADQILAAELKTLKRKKPAPETVAEGPSPSAAEVQERKEAEAVRDAEAKKYVAASVDAGKSILTAVRPVTDGGQRFIEIARMIAPVARDSLGNAQLAGQIWHGVSRKVDRPEWKAECEVAAADIAVNDLANAKAAKMFLEAARAHLGRGHDGPVASRLERVWGDYYALTGDGGLARKAYQEAEASLGSARRLAQQTAWQGAHSRSVEQYLRESQLDRAAEQIHQWEDQFPADKVSGYITLLYAQYWASRGMHDQVVAMSDQLMAVNRESPYVDRLLVLAAQSELKRGRSDRAVATLESLVKDYPGSPLVTAAKEEIAKIVSNHGEDANNRGKPR